MNDEKNSELREWMKSDRLPNFDWPQGKQDLTQDEETWIKSLIWNPNNLVVGPLMKLRSDDINKNDNSRNLKIDPRIDQSLLSQHDKDAEFVKDASLYILQKMTALRYPATKGSDIWVNDFKCTTTKYRYKECETRGENASPWKDSTNSTDNKRRYIMPTGELEGDSTEDAASSKFYRESNIC